MKTIALRFSDNIAPDCGTIVAHDEIINCYGFVWYGKLGSRISKQATEMVLNNDEPRILLINSGKPQRYWAYVEEIQYEVLSIEAIPSYYRENRDKFNTWFRIVRFEQAEHDVMSKCTVMSSHHPLNLVSKASMNPYFKIEYIER